MSTRPYTAVAGLFHMLSLFITNPPESALHYANFHPVSPPSPLSTPLGVDDEKGAQVFKVDPAGHYLPYKAVATGKAEPEAMNFLEKKVDTLSTLSENDTIELAISAMQYVLSTDFKSTEIEVGLVSVGSKFRVLKEDEIEERLNAIAEKSDS
jgi:20S proteasome alpha/beta subunit